MKKENCYSCIFFSKSPGIRNYFIYFCSYWGLKSVNKIPLTVIFESLGKKCPFYKEKKNCKSKDDKNEKNDNLNIII